MNTANESKKVKLIIGLGNPGKEYEKTRHNAGILFIQNKISENSPEGSRQSGTCGASKFQIPNSKKFEYIKINNLIFLKLLTFMNDSGRAVKEAVKYFKIKPEELLVVRDDSDIIFGNYKLKFNSGSGGHKGVESIINYLKTKSFWQLKIGVRDKRHVRDKRQGTRDKGQGTRIKAGEFVLKKFSKNDLSQLEKIFNETRIDF